MQIVKTELFPYVLPLIRPLTFQGQTRQRLKRKGSIVALTDKAGHRGLGEIAPLAKLSEPPICFAVDMALWHLRALQAGTTLSQLFSNYMGLPAARHVVLNALLDLKATDDVESLARAKVAQGFQTLKVKVGRQSIADDIETICRVRQAVGPLIEIRLDANRAYRLGQAVSLARALSHVRASYIEEPLQNPCEIQAFYDETGLPVGLDESLVEGNIDLAQLRSCLGALVMKPAQMGPVRNSLSLMHWAVEHRIPAVLSSSFESGLGLYFLVQLASLLGQTAHGFDTFSWFRCDGDETQFIINNGRVDVDDAWKAIDRWQQS